MRNLIKWLKYDTTLRCWPLKNKGYSVISELWKLSSSFLYLLIYGHTSRLCLSIYTYVQLKRGTDVNLMELIDYAISNNVKITCHHLSRIGLSYSRRVLYKSDTVDSKPLWYAYICEILVNHDSAKVLNICFFLCNDVPLSAYFRWSFRNWWNTYT